MESTPSIEKAIGGGLAELFHVSPITSVLIFVVIGLCWFIKSLLQDLRDERQLNRDAFKDSTAVIAGLSGMVSELKGMLNAIANKL